LKKSFPEPRFEIATKNTSPAIGVKTSFVKDGTGVFAQVGLDVKFDTTVSKLDIACQLNTRGECKASFTGSDLGVAGTKLGFGTDTDDTGLTTLSGDLGFSNDQVSAKVGGKFSVERAKLDSVNFALVGQYPDNLFFGVSANKEVPKDKLTLEGGVAWQFNDAKAAVKVTQTENLRAAVSWWQSISNEVKVASVINFDLLADGKGAVDAGVGATWKVDESTSFRGKWAVVSKPGTAATFRASFATEQRVTKNILAGVGVDLNASKFLGRKDAGDADHAFGFKVAFE
jgi:hypothetical protein